MRFEDIKVIVHAGENNPQPIRVASAPLTMLYKNAQTPLKVEGIGFFDITPDMCTLHAQHTAENGLKLHEDTPGEVMRIIRPTNTTPPWSALLAIWKARTAPYDLDHLIGRIDLTLKVIDMGVRRIQWSQPEAGLHPAWACDMADFLIRHIEVEGDN